MSWQTWNNVDNPWQPFTEQQWAEGAFYCESGVTSSPYSPHPYWGEYNRRYYDNLMKGFPYICCETPTHEFGHIVAGRVEGEINVWYCSVCRTIWIKSPRYYENLDSAEMGALTELMSRNSVRFISSPTEVSQEGYIPDRP